MSEWQVRRFILFHDCRARHPVEPGRRRVEGVFDASGGRGQAGFAATQNQARTSPVGSHREVLRASICRGMDQVVGAKRPARLPVNADAAGGLAAVLNRMQWRVWSAGSPGGVPGRGRAESQLSNAARHALLAWRRDLDMPPPHSLRPAHLASSTCSAACQTTANPRFLSVMWR